MRNGMKLVAVTGLIAALYAPGIRFHWNQARDGHLVPYDAVQYVPPFDKYNVTNPVPTTYSKEYYLNAVMPPLYRWIGMIAARTGDVRTAHLLMTYLVFAAFLGIMGRLAWVLGGSGLCFAVLALTLTAPGFLKLGFLGSAPRMYAYPLVALVLLGLVRASPVLLAASALLGALLYPVAAVIAGASLSTWLLLLPTSVQGSVAGWSMARRILYVGLTGSLTVALVMPLWHGSERYGPTMTEADIGRYPEAGPDGRYLPSDRLPYKLFGSDALVYYVSPMVNATDSLVPFLNMRRWLSPDGQVHAVAAAAVVFLLVILAAAKFSLLEQRDGRVARLLSFFAVCLVLHFVAWLAAPTLYIPNRYLVYSLPFVIPLLLPWSLQFHVRRLLGSDGSGPVVHAALLGFLFGYLAAFGGVGNARPPDFWLTDPAMPLFRQIRTLPTDSLIAGWPSGIVRHVEYLTRRNAFLTFDRHQVLHQGYANVMRERMDSLFEAYFSTDATSIRRLRTVFGVTHLVVEKRHFTDPRHLPEYFPPWKSRIEPRMRQIRGREYLLDQLLLERAAVLSDNDFILLDLGKLP